MLVLLERDGIVIGSLTALEEQLINAYSRKIRDQWPEQIISVYVYGSKARGDCNKNSDIDILVVMRDEDWRLSDEIRQLGYELDDEIDSKFSIIVIPENRMEAMTRDGIQFIKNVSADAVSI